MQAYSPDVRVRIVAAVDPGMSNAQAVRTFGVGEETDRRYVIQRRVRGSLDPRPHPSRPPLISPEQREQLCAQLVEYPTGTMADHCNLWEAATGVRVAVPTMHWEIRRLG